MCLGSGDMPKSIESYRKSQSMGRRAHYVVYTTPMRVSICIIDIQEDAELDEKCTSFPDKSDYRDGINDGSISTYRFSTKLCLIEFPMPSSFELYYF